MATPPIPENLSNVDNADLSYQVMPQEGSVSTPTSSPQPPPAPRPLGVPVPPTPPKPNLITPPTPGTAPEPRDLLPYDSSSPLPFFRTLKFKVAVGVIIVIILGVGSYYFLGRKSQTSSSSTPTAPAKQLPNVWVNKYFNVASCTDLTRCGVDADPDNDGLSNYDEFVNNTNPLSPDTDADGLADGDEVHIYKTDPTLKYTDRRDLVSQNNWTDGVQIKNGYDPLTPGVKFTDVRNQQIANDTAKYGLHEPTITTLSPTTASIDMSAWHTYSNAKYGFEFKYPTSLQLENFSTSPFPTVALKPTSEKASCFDVQTSNTATCIFTITVDAAVNRNDSLTKLEKIYPPLAISVSGKQAAKISTPNEQQIFIPLPNYVLGVSYDNRFKSTANDQTLNNILSTFKYGQ